MSGETAFLHKPRPWIGISAPPFEYGSNFYNPGQTVAGKDKLENFMKTLFGLFMFTSSSDESAVINEMLEEVEVDEDYLWDLVPGESTHEYGEDLSSLRKEDLLRALAEADQAKKELEENIQGDLGENLENWSDYFAESGVYNSLILFPALEAYNNFDAEEISSNKNRIKERANEYIDSMSSSDLEWWCEELGVLAVKNKDGTLNAEETKRALKEKASEMVEGLSNSFAQFRESSLEAKKITLETNAIIPGITMLGVNTIGRSMANNLEEDYENKKAEFKEFEYQEKKFQKKREAERKAAIKEVLAKKNQPRVEKKG